MSMFRLFALLSNICQGSRVLAMSGLVAVSRCGLYGFTSRLVDGFWY